MIPYPRPGWLPLLFRARGSSSRGVLLKMLFFGGVAQAVVWLDTYVRALHLPAGVHETTGALIALILAFRTNTSYARFWEARTLWGSIVNGSRNLHRVGMRHSLADAATTKSFSTWIVVFAHVTRRRLRGEKEWPEIERLLPASEIRDLQEAHHPSLFAADHLSEQLGAWRADGQLDSRLCEHAERLVAGLVDNLGGCERILRTPMPFGYALLMERFIALYLFTLPFMLVTRIEALTPIATMAIAYPILLIDALGIELEDPFGHDASDLPLSRICITIERDVLGTEPPPALIFGGADRGD